MAVNAGNTEEPDQLQRLFEDDLRSLVELTFTNGPVQERHIRQASVIVRRWLCDNELSNLTRRLGVSVTFPVQDDGHLFEKAKNDASIDYYLSVGVKFDGRPMMQLYASRIDTPPTWAAEMATVGVKMVRLGYAMKRPSLFFEGVVFPLDEVVRFACNKHGGAHHDTSRNQREEVLERASRHLTFGPPAETLPAGRKGATHLALERSGTEVLNGTSLVVMVAATMLINIHFDGQPLCEIRPVKQSPLLARAKRRLQSVFTFGRWR
ncbi:hypothetical protein [Stagnihabitans tardus]|uniref:Uncharacterized protein n=1 Tax=Stagnihabitans tardus TaxID=2699202 RepID=A0AAE4YCS3_9RHOB|nr:hypothetical protein [Stagnihabitans tardus]NBZ89282.1 hypothetical protein [Stagnihabitans tardus]